MIHEGWEAVDEINYWFCKWFAQVSLVVQEIYSRPSLSNTSQKSPLFPLSALPSNRSSLSGNLPPNLSLHLGG